MDLAETSEKLQRLLDDNPTKAIYEALKLSGNINIELLKAAIFVDAGAMLKNFDVVVKGVEIYRNAVDRFQDSSELKYNLANGLHSLAWKKGVKSCSHALFYPELSSNKINYI